MKLYKNLATALKEREEVKMIKISLKGKFPEELFDLTELEEAYLEGDSENFPLDIKGWKKLKLLSIKWPSFKGDLSSVFTLPSLKNLKIIETPIKTFLLPIGGITAPLEILTLKSLGLQKLPEEIAMLEHLREFYLQGNQLSELPFSFRDLTKLKRLNLDQNQFKQFPDFFKNMPTLGHLSIDGNDFSEEEKERILRDFFITVN